MHISGFNIIMVNNFISILLPFFLPLPPQTPLARSTLGPNSGWYQEVKRNIQNKALFCSTEKGNDKIHVSNISFKKLRVICNREQKAYLHNWGYRLATTVHAQTYIAATESPLWQLVIPLSVPAYLYSESKPTTKAYPQRAQRKKNYSGESLVWSC